jgi:hypothetical protein
MTNHEPIDTTKGDARRVADTPTLEALAALYREGGWPVQVDGDAFTAPYSAPDRALAGRCGRDSSRTLPWRAGSASVG